MHVSTNMVDNDNDADDDTVTAMTIPIASSPPQGLPPNDEFSVKLRNMTAATMQSLSLSDLTLVELE